MNVEFINPFLSSMLNVMSTMAQMELKPEKPKLKKNETAHGDVSGLIGMVSDQAKGSLSITFEGSLALATMKNMVGEAPDETKIKTRGGEVEYDHPNKRFANDGTGRVEDVVEKLTAPNRFFRNQASAVRQLERYKLDITQFAFQETDGGRVQISRI